MCDNTELKVFKVLKFLGEILIIEQTIYHEQRYTSLLNLVDNHCWQNCNGLILRQQFLNVTHFHHFNL